MTEYKIYVLIVCLIVFALLTTLSIFCVSLITKQSLKLINAGLEDEKILREYKKRKERERKTKCGKIADVIFSTVVCLLFLVMFLGSMTIKLSENSCCGILPSYRVVQTGSMSTKHEKNTYLTQNNLNNQIQTFDLIRTAKLPAEKDLKLYDIVVYEVDGILLVHRIVKIEEPNEKHPESRYFLLQGDAVEAPDRFPVLYEQMRAIYTGTRVPFIGSFIMFMQSFAGWLCMLLVLGATIATPILEKKMLKAENLRIAILFPDAETANAQNEKKTSIFDKFRKDKNVKTFAEKLEENSVAKERFDEITNHLDEISNVRVIKGKKTITYKVKNLPIIKLLIKGKTLNAYLNLNPSEYEKSKYIFTDVSHVKKHANYPMRVKVTSDRQVKWVKELISQVINKGDK